MPNATRAHKVEKEDVSFPHILLVIRHAQVTDHLAELTYELRVNFSAFQIARSGYALSLFLMS